MESTIVLSDYDISKKCGFIPESQIAELGGIFGFWEKVLLSLPSHTQDKTVRKEIDALPEVEFSDSTLKNEQEWKQAYVLLTFLSQAYLRMDDELPDKLPEKLAKPWVAVSNHLGLKPFVSYAALVLYNFRLRDESKPMEIDNIAARNSFTGLGDESWFYIVHMAAEIAAVPGLIAIAEAYHYMAKNDYDALTRCLNDLSKSLDTMQGECQRMFDKVDLKSKCDPDAFYNTLRPFFSKLPKGIIYEGIEDQPQNYAGASAAQTSSIYAFDIFLGVKHTGEGSEFITEIRQYMPRKHRDFLEKLDDMPSVKEFCKDSNNVALIKSYNAAIESLLSFRAFHLQKLISEYIFVPKYRREKVPQAEKPNLDEEKGTGGTKLSEFLQKIVEETKQLKID